jgi:hypothetical protein
MSAFQAGKCTAQPCEKLAGTIAKSLVIVEVNNNKQQLQVCYPHNVSECYRCKALLEKDCNQGKWAIFARLLIISIVSTFFK